MLLIEIVFLTALAGLMGSWTGAGGHKLWRRLGVPTISAIFGCLFMWSLAPLILIARFGPYSMGYGQPDSSDEGSKLAIFLNKFIKNKQSLCIATRAIIGLIDAAIVLSMAFFFKGFTVWLLCGLLIVWNHIYWGAIKEKEGVFKFMGKELLWEEFALYGINTFLIFIFMKLIN